MNGALLFNTGKSVGGTVISQPREPFVVLLYEQLERFDVLHRQIRELALVMDDVSHHHPLIRLERDGDDARMHLA